MTSQTVMQKSPSVRRRGGISRGAVLLAGVILLPIALNLAFNSYGALTVDGALRMAFAAVAGQTIAILSAITALVLTIKRRYAWPAIASFALITAVITASAFATIGAAGDTFLDRFTLIEQVEQLNP